MLDGSDLVTSSNSLAGVLLTENEITLGGYNTGCSVALVSSTKDSNSKITLRITFKKIGKLQYISHLDLVRTMHKIIILVNFLNFSIKPCDNLNFIGKADCI